jgi:hypothetical protein
MMTRAVLPVALAAAVVVLAADGPGKGPRFFPDDPIWVDPDRSVDVGTALPIVDAANIYDFVENTFIKPGDHADVPAENVNTLDEVPDSSWFTNRIGRREMPVGEIVRGPDRLDSLDIQDWPIIQGKPTGLQAGYRVVAPDGRLWQIEFDPPSNPEMASGAEVIGTAFYHAFGYHTVDVYVVDFDPRKVQISPKATIRDFAVGGRRRFTHADFRLVMERAAQRPDGRVRALASRFADGQPVGNFRYYGTRPDDPNDIFPHEHRRELRANRVFAAWLNHDDSRGPNSLDMVDETDGRRWVKHYMFDFGSIMGSGTAFAQKPRPGNEYILEWKPSFLTLATLGFYFRPWITIKYPHVPPSVGRFEAARFDPLTWKPEYPNQAFDNLRPEDAFWAARIVSRFSDAAVRAVVDKARYSDPRASEYVTQTLIARRDKVVRAWINGVNPLVNAALDAGGRFSCENAAVAAGAATRAKSYRLEWLTLDNATGQTAASGEPVEIDGGGPITATLPAALASGHDYVGVRIAGLHPEQPAWSARPATFFFRRTATGWDTVGVQRFP